MLPVRLASFWSWKVICPVKRSGLALLMFFFFGLPAWALEPSAEMAADDGIFSLQIENDGVTEDADKYYTHGVRFSYLSSKEAPLWSRKTADYLPFFRQQGNVRINYTLGQSIFTPNEISTKTLIEDDRPYAGWLYVGLGLISDSRSGSSNFKRWRDSLELNIGMVGPASLAEQFQVFSHKVRGANEPKGWDHQLKDEPGILLIYDRQWQGRYDTKLDGLGIDLTPHVGGALGNIMTYAATGFTLRFGRHLDNDYGVPIIRPSLPGSVYFAQNSGFGWYLFTGFEGRVILQNIFLDGNTFKDSHSVDKEPLVGDFQAGLVLTWKGYRLSFTSVHRTREFEGQESSTRYGAFSLAIRL